MAQNKLLKMAPVSARRMVEALLLYEKTGLGDIKFLKGRPGLRLRVGDYRAIFEIETGEITVLDVGHRSHIYD